MEANQQLQTAVQKSERKFWECLCENCRLKNDPSLHLTDLLEPDSHIISNFSNKVCTKNCSVYEKAVIQKIEYELKGHLNKLILRREKAKILCDKKLYAHVHPLVKNEIRRLRKKVAPSDIILYIRLCVNPNESVKQHIEVDLESKLKSVIMERSRSKSVEEFNRLNESVLKEWTNLNKTLSDEDIVIYIISLQKKRCRDGCYQCSFLSSIFKLQ